MAAKKRPSLAAAAAGANGTHPPAAAPGPVEPAPLLALVPLVRITPSPHNPRKTFAPAALDQLAASIREKGVLQPVVVRPHPEVADHYELVVGERRWRASAIAGRETIPAVVRQMSDRAAAEAAVVENDSREDVPPLEQAHGYRRLLDLGDDAAGVAAKIGRSEDYVLERLQLTKLIPALQEDLAKGWITFTHARVLAKVERPEDQAELRDQDLYDVHPDDVYEGESPTPYPVAQLRRAIGEAYRRDLAGAPWKLDDAELVPAAGSCAACPKRSGTRPGLFDELAEGNGKKKADQCFDRTCFDAKRAAVIDLGLRKAAERAGGGEVLKVTTEHYSRDPDVLRADRYDVVSAKDAKAAKPGEVKQAVIADGKRAGQVVTVRVKKESPASRSGGGDDFARRQREAQKKADVGKAAALAANGLVAEKVAAAFAGVPLPAAAMHMVRQLALALPDIVWSDASRLVARRRGIKQQGSADREAVEAHAAALNAPAELLGLVYELVAARRSFNWGSLHYGRGNMAAAERAWWAAFGVDQARLFKQVAEGKKPAAKPAAKPSANGHAKPKGKGKRAKAAAPTGGGAGDEDEAAAAPAWRSRPVEDLRPRPFLLTKFRMAGIATVGELDDAIESERDLGLSHMDQRDLAAAIAALEQRPAAPPERTLQGAHA
jgi:ParB family chromosome partitioning protein